MFNHQPQLYHNVRPNLDVLMGGESLDSASAGLAAMQGKDPMRAKLALAQTLEPLAPEYDMVLIDCPPGDEVLQTNAVAAARWALVPVKSDKVSRKGLSAVAKRLDAVIDVNLTSTFSASSSSTSAVARPGSSGKRGSRSATCSAATPISP